MPEKHYYEQYNYTNEYLIPYFSKYISDFKGLKILEIGCAEAGLLAAFRQIGADVYGIEISQDRVNISKEKNPDLQIFVGDVSSRQLLNNIKEEFDFIVMREVIEHIEDKETTFKNLVKLLKKGGYLFISFPPKFSPYAGHQQIAKSIPMKLPYIHVLPKALLQWMEKEFHEKKGLVDEIKYNFFTGMAIGRFERLLNESKFEIIQKDHFLFRPVYRNRFGLPTFKLPGIPLIREFITFGYEIFLKKE